MGICKGTGQGELLAGYSIRYTYVMWMSTILHLALCSVIFTLGMAWHGWSVHDSFSTRRIVQTDPGIRQALDFILCQKRIWVCQAWNLPAPISADLLFVVHGCVLTHRFVIHWRRIGRMSWMHAKKPQKNRQGGMTRCVARCAHVATTPTPSWNPAGLGWSVVRQSNYRMSQSVLLLIMMYWVGKARY